MSILVIGNGYIGSWFSGVDVISGRHFDSRDCYVDLGKYEAVVNCVGYRGGDSFESWMANVSFPIFLSRRCSQANVKYIHLTTTKVGHFDNYANDKDYTDHIIPLINNNYTIYRLPWLFGGKDSFMSTVIDCINKDKIVTVYNELGSPTYVKDVVEYIVNNINNHNNEEVCLYNGVDRTRSEWVKEICSLMKKPVNYELVERNQRIDQRAYGKKVKVGDYYESMQEVMEGLNGRA